MNLFSVKYKLDRPDPQGDDSNKTERIVGKASVYLDGKVVEEEPIYYYRIPEKKKGLFDFIKEIFLTVLGVRSNG
jgi:D-alanyl-D-alanine carboxypeptidase